MKTNALEKTSSLISKSLGYLQILIFSIILASCGGGDGNESPTITGQFIDDPVAGLVYHCSSGDFHETNADGEFSCFDGDDVTFYLGANQLGPVRAVNSIISPYTLFPDDPLAAINLARLLQSTDSDDDPDTITIDVNLVSSLPGNINFSSPTFEDDMESIPGMHLVSAEQAADSLNESIALFTALYPVDRNFPVADAGVDQTVSTGSTVTLDGSGSFDADGDTLTYTWGFLSKPSESGAILDWVVSPTFVADRAGEYEVLLMVSDGLVTDTDSVVITVSDDGVSNDANLVALSLTSTLPADTLSPAFDSNITSYTATVDNDYSWITITPTASDSNATIVVIIPDRAIPVNSGASSGTIGLDVGQNSMSVVVTAEAGNTQAYNLTVTRLEPVLSVPAAPQGLQATAGDTEVALSWNSVNGATSYTVYWNTSGGVSTSDSSIDVGSTQFTHASLTNDTTYYYRVSASNTSGESTLSSEASATSVVLAPSVPAAPQGLQATAGDTEVALSWNTTSGATNYTVYWNTTGSVTTSDSSIDASSSTQVTHSSLTNDTTYYYRVSASNATGEGVLSSEVSATPVAPATEVPADPLNFQVTAGDAQIALSWDAATGAESYAVYWTDTGVFTEENSIDIGNNTQYTLTGLTNGTRYYCRVYAINSIGETYSNVLFATPEIPVPQALSAIAGSGFTELAWNALEGDYNYTIYWNTIGNVSSSDAAIDATNLAQLTHSSLVSGTTYYYRVSATGASGEGVLSEQISVHQQDTDWQWVNPQPNGHTFFEFAWGNNRFVGVAGGGGVYTSDDAVTWVQQSSGSAEDLWDITWNGSLFVAVGDSGSILTSPDGTVWTVRSSGALTNLFKIIWNDSLFVVVGYNTILTSPDGEVWTAQTHDAAQWFRSIAWNGDVFVIYENGYAPSTHTSQDGVNWTRHSDTISNIADIVWDGDQFLAPSYGSVFSSTDGISWADLGAPNAIPPHILWDGSQLVGVGNGYVGTSPDGLTWTDQSGNITSTTDAFTVGTTVFWNGSQYVAAGYTGVVLTSNNAVNWTQHLPTSTITNEELENVIWNGSIFVAVGRTGTILTSADGITWTVQDSGSTAMRLTGIAWNGTRFVAVGTSGTILTSLDGEAWTSRDVETTQQLDDVTWGGGQFVAVAYKTVYTSADGINWIGHEVEVSGYLSLRSVAWSGSAYVAIATDYSDSEILTSLDGETWTSVHTTWLGLRDLVWGNDIFVATGEANYSVTSTDDGATWTNNYLGFSGYMSHVDWDGSQFVSSYGGTLYTSPDGVNWATKHIGLSGSSIGINSITWDDSGQAFGVGNGGLIIINTSWE
jgi:fibronectin type 3 domain-containing protein